MLVVVFHRTLVGDSTFFGAGCMYVAPDNALGDSVRADQGIYGMFTSGNYTVANGVQSPWYQQGEGSPDHRASFWPTYIGEATSRKFQPLGIILDPLTNDSTRYMATTVWSSLYGTTEDATGYNYDHWQKAFFEHRDGSFESMPIPIKRRLSFRMGTVRQMRIGSGWPSRVSRADAAGVLQDITLGTNAFSVASDLLIFSNDPNP